MSNAHLQVYEPGVTFRYPAEASLGKWFQIRFIRAGGLAELK